MLPYARRSFSFSARQPRVSNSEGFGRLLRESRVAASARFRASDRRSVAGVRARRVDVDRCRPPSPQGSSTSVGCVGNRLPVLAAARAVGPAMESVDDGIVLAAQSSELVRLLLDYGTSALRLFLAPTPSPTIWIASPSSPPTAAPRVRLFRVPRSLRIRAAAIAACAGARIGGGPSPSGVPGENWLWGTPYGSLAGWLARFFVRCSSRDSSGLQSRSVRSSMRSRTTRSPWAIGVAACFPQFFSFALGGYARPSAGHSVSGFERNPNPSVLRRRSARALWCRRRRPSPAAHLPTGNSIDGIDRFCPSTRRASCQLGPAVDWSRRFAFFQRRSDN